MLASLFRSWWRVSARWWATEGFQGEAESRSHLKTFIGIVIGALAGLAVSALMGRLTGATRSGFTGLASVWTTNAKAPFWSWLVLVPVGVLYGFYLFEVILWVLARWLGGKGTFGMQAYLQSLFYAPLAIVQQVVVMLPGAGKYLFAVVAACSLWPTTTSLKAAHGYSTARALTTWLIPIGLNVIVVAIVVMTVARLR